MGSEKISPPLLLGENDIAGSLLNRWEGSSNAVWMLNRLTTGMPSVKWHSALVNVAPVERGLPTSFFERKVCRQHLIRDVHQVPALRFGRHRGENQLLEGCCCGRP